MTLREWIKYIVLQSIDRYMNQVRDTMGESEGASRMILDESAEAAIFKSCARVHAMMKDPS